MGRGYDNLSLNHQMLVNITMDEYLAGAVIHDLAKPHHLFTIVGAPTWLLTGAGLPYLQLDGANDWLTCPAADSVDLNFTFEDFTIAAWINLTSGDVDPIITQGVTNVDGFEFFVFANNLSLRLNQAAAHTDISAVDCFVSAVWNLVVVTRNGNTGQFYVNGAAVTTIGGGALVDPVSCAGGNILYIGHDEAGAEFLGNMGGGGFGPRVWGRELSASEIALMFEMERHWFGI